MPEGLIVVLHGELKLGMLCTCIFSIYCCLLFALFPVGCDIREEAVNNSVVFVNRIPWGHFDI